MKPEPIATERRNGLRRYSMKKPAYRGECDKRADFLRYQKIEDNGIITTL